MKVAIMQPYIFPYIGYLQLINLVDTFIFYDDVNFIKQGWVNRNNILVNGQSFRFTIPLEKSSSFVKICDVQINNEMWVKWKDKFLKTLEQNYKKAPFFNSGFEIVDNVLSSYYKEMSISELAISSITELCKYMNINTKIISTSSKYENNHLSGKDRVIDICIRENANHYINPIGGKELYDQTSFKSFNLDLNFIQPLSHVYNQPTKHFIPWLSSIDIIMYNSKDSIKEHLTKFKLI